MDILAETIEMAKASGLTARQICARADVGIPWYSRLIRGDFTDPGVCKIQRLHAVLKMDKQESEWRERAKITRAKKCQK